MTPPIPSTNFEEIDDLLLAAYLGGSTEGTFGRNERGHYDAVAEAISVLDEPEMKQVRIDITTSICADDN
nr:hypothetical protein CFP56_49775 [Quercus suber]